MKRMRRRLPVGAEVTADGVSFRVWAPRRERVEVVLEGSDKAAVALQREPRGYHSGVIPGIGAGARYRYRLDGGGAFPDPASRYQPEGPEGPSQVVDPTAYEWQDRDWKGPQPRGQVIYELHLGTYTPEGTYRSLIDKLPHLRELGVTTVELMPVAEFPGDFGWGYDGVDLFAPCRLYGQPDDLRTLIDAAHQQGLAVILDVVYNHFGPRGNFLRELSPYYFAKRRNEWGDAIDYHGRHSRPVRELVLSNVEHWIREYHFDGLRLDATQDIHDESDEHLVAAITRTARQAAGDRTVLVYAENEPQQSWYVRPVEDGGYGLDGMWNDDFHHAAVVAADGKREAYYSPYHGTARELLAAVKWGFLYQGQYYPWQKQRRGTPSLRIPAHRFVCCLENHDQVANSALGLRLHQMTSPGRWRALTALLLLAPHTPLLFQGQELASDAPFLYFADHPPDLAAAVRKGRAEFLRQFARLRGPGGEQVVPHPDERATFERCRIDWRETPRSRQALALHRDLLRLRRDEEVFRTQDSQHLDGATLDRNSMVLRWFGASEDGSGDRLLLFNLGADLQLPAASEPLLAPPLGLRWHATWSSESFVYGGTGTPPLLDDSRAGWLVPGESTVLLEPRRVDPADEEGDTARLDGIDDDQQETGERRDEA